MAHEAEEVPLGIEPEPGPCPGHGGAGVRIFVADTGLVAGAEADHAWMAGVRGDPDPDPAAIPPGHDPDIILPYAGHGTFVTGVLRCAAPAAEIYCANVFNLAGSALEADAVPKLDRALDEGYGLFNLTISASTRKLLPLAAFNAWRRRLRDSKGVACVVAAGNNGLERPFSPAAFSRHDRGGRAGRRRAQPRLLQQFRQLGGRVRPGPRPGQRVGDGEYRCYVPPADGQDRHFYGMARCSGTSFSTPIVTGRIADRMSRTGENAEQAAAAVLARARFIPGVGRVVQPCRNGDCRHEGLPGRGLPGPRLLG